MAIYPVKCENTGKVFRSAHDAAVKMFGEKRGSNLLCAIRKNRPY